MYTYKHIHIHIISYLFDFLYIYKKKKYLTEYKERVNFIIKKVYPYIKYKLTSYFSRLL